MVSAPQPPRYEAKAPQHWRQRACAARPPVAAPVIEAGLCTSKKGMDLQGGKGMRQVFSGMAMASLGLAIVLTLPTLPGVIRLSNGFPTSVMLRHSVLAVTPRSVSPTIQNCRLRLPRIRSTPPNHYKALEEGAGGFKVLEPAQRKQLPGTGQKDRRELVGEARSISVNGGARWDHHRYCHDERWHWSRHRGHARR